VEREGQQQKAGPENTPKLFSICEITDVTNISPLIQLLGKIAKLCYQIKALAGNQVKIQDKIPESNRTNY
jgi:hypothetical protein